MLVRYCCNIFAIRTSCAHGGACGNRCADCDAELTDYGNIWASVDQGCFVCVHCLAVHRSLGFRTKSVNMDFWAVDEVARMTSMGNVKASSPTQPLPACLC